MVDFENVNSKGLTGIENLNQEDRVIILYSENSDTISFEMHKKVLESKADIRYFKVKVGGKNALDFQLATLLGYLVSKGDSTHIFIVSNDKGFDRLHDFWNGNDFISEKCIVYRIPNILKAHTAKNDSSIYIENDRQNNEDSNCRKEDSVNNNVEIKKTSAKGVRKPRKNLSELLSELLKDICNDEDIDKIKECLLHALSKEDFHNSMAKIFKQQATDFYKLLRPKYIRLKNLSDKENGISSQPSAKKEKSGKISQLSAELNRILSDTCSNEDINNIEKCICTTQSKQALYLSMLKIYKRERGCEIYKLLKPEYDKLVTLKEENP